MGMLLWVWVWLELGWGDLGSEEFGSVEFGAAVSAAESVDVSARRNERVIATTAIGIAAKWTSIHGKKRVNIATKRGTVQLTRPAAR